MTKKNQENSTVSIEPKPLDLNSVSPEELNKKTEELFKDIEQNVER